MSAIYIQVNLYTCVLICEYETRAIDHGPDSVHQYTNYKNVYLEGPLESWNTRYYALEINSELRRLEDGTAAVSGIGPILRRWMEKINKGCILLIHESASLLNM